MTEMKYVTFPNLWTAVVAIVIFFATITLTAFDWHSVSPHSGAVHNDVFRLEVTYMRADMQRIENKLDKLLEAEDR